MLTGMSGSGPFARELMLGGHTTPHGMPWFTLAIWGVYLLLVAKTKLGDAHPVLFLFGGMIWCGIGTMLGVYAGLAIT